MPRRPLSFRVALLAAALTLAAASSRAGRLEDDLGRAETRVWAAPHEVAAGVTVSGSGLPERLDRLGYRRLRARPIEPGAYFWGHEVFWIYRRPFRDGGHDRGPRLLRLELRRADGRIVAVTGPDGESLDDGEGRLEPELLAESLDGDRAPRRLVRLDELPEHVWKSVLAAEDARFFEHSGIDARSVARAMLANAKAGKVVQGGSTITQQLVKLRDMTPKRTFGRKLSEAARALALEAEYDKEEILEAYLNTVYYGHVDGVAVHGIGAAARAYFSKPASRLGLSESALLAAVIQGPNRLNPWRHGERALERQRWVLGRLRELAWAAAADVLGAERRGLPALRLDPPDRLPAAGFLSWIRDEVANESPGRVKDGRGVVAATSLDPWLQLAAEEALSEGLSGLRRRVPGLRRRPLSAALVALDSRTGDVLAYVGGDPNAAGDAFDRVRRARRQPGSAVKPLVLLEGLETCGGKSAVYPARRVLDAPVQIDLPSGPWEPVNPDGGYRGVVTVRRALVDSLNTPFVRLARHCGFGRTAARLRDAGLALPDEPPPAFVLGAVESTPLEMAEAFTLFANGGRRLRARPLTTLRRPEGRSIDRRRPRDRKVVSAATAFLLRDMMREAVESGTAQAAALPGIGAFGKTGTSSDQRDAWFVGGAGAVVAAVWVGVDDGSPLGLGGGGAAAPIWREFMRAAAPSRPAPQPQRPRNVIERWVDEQTGLLVVEGRRGSRREFFRRDTEPPRRRFWRSNDPLAAIE